MTHHTDNKLPRSALYVPGDAPEKLEKALSRGADELIIDLEDAVRSAHKDSALMEVVSWLHSITSTKTPIWVRINPGDRRLNELQALAECANLFGVIVAKTENSTELYEVDQLLTSVNSTAKVIPLLESAHAVLDAREIASAPRVHRLQVGEADLRSEIGATLGRDEIEMLHVRSHVLLVSAAAKISPPLAPVSTQFRDVEAFRESTIALKRLGFFGRACIHPAQIPIANEVFTPSAEAVARAQKLLETFSGVGAGAAESGEMIDEAILRGARRLLDQVHELDTDLN